MLKGTRSFLKKKNDLIPSNNILLSHLMISLDFVNYIFLNKSV